MLALLLLLVASQAPAVPGETTLVSFCKQGRLTACQQLQAVDPGALEDHPTLRGLYKPRDERFKARAKDKESHCGYQKWHRDVDDEVIAWLKENEGATPEQFMRKLREIYNRKDMLERFPNGF